MHVGKGVVAPAMIGWARGMCVNCDIPLPLDRLAYCTDLCAETASLIRYRRATWRDGRDKDPLVEDSIRTRMAFVLSGGYDRKARALPAHVRAEVLAANDGLCCCCQERPAEQVDHIDGPGNARSNLQGLCDLCHRFKTHKRLVPIPADAHDVHARVEKIWKRFLSPIPVRVCDDAQIWDSLYPEVREANRYRWADDATEIDVPSATWQ